MTTQPDPITPTKCPACGNKDQQVAVDERYPDGPKETLPVWVDNECWRCSHNWVADELRQARERIAELESDLEEMETANLNQAQTLLAACTWVRGYNGDIGDAVMRLRKRSDAMEAAFLAYHESYGKDGRITPAIRAAAQLCESTKDRGEGESDAD